ncbi:protein EXECUTER 2, chloroplastic isoform X3 [Physcomitrium patens]|uniref:UVR domain-containing protein n=1 Tax=Physcomitrium patens TaxID=3218 RepID=A0A7I4BAH3_PHYPA|nr:protein EXECUTER 2, chloroplastic-like isoform X3 [Physcomitrium patens]|eukprot:XP_024401257.1 protein EXECUTER 2, chloroplastic-like isoform X3 [Physcomitrella patens]
MRAVVAAVGATLRVDTLSPSSTAQVVCKTNFLNASGCLAIQTVAQQQRVCSSFHKVEKALDVGLQNKRRFNHSNSFACRCSASGSSEDASNVPQEGDHTNDGEVGPSSVWDLPSRHKQMQAAAAKMGDPLRDMETEQESDWVRWQKVFAEVESCESLATMLKIQMEKAVEQEDFQSAAKCKAALDAVTEKDIVADVMNGLEQALADERYDDATLLRDKAGAGLVGWWVGLAEGGNDPYGRIINIYAAHGRLVAKGYTARQLATAAAGVPLFEIFITKEGERHYGQQAVYLQRDATVTTEPSSGSAAAVDTNVLDVENSARDEDTSNTAEESSEDASESRKGKAGDSAILDEPLSKIMSFLKDRIPDVKLKVFKVIAPEGADAELPKIVEQLMEQEDSSSSKQQDLSEASTSNTNINSATEKKGLGSKFPLDGKIPVGGIGEDEKEMSIRLVVGGVLQNNIDSEPSKLPVRVPARIEHKGQNAFTFHIEDTGSTPAGAAPSKELSYKMATIASQAPTDLMADDVAKVLWNVETVPVKVSKEMSEIIRVAVSQAQRRRGLFTSTNFRRINVLESSTDPLCGLYIGAFGPYTSEVVQLQRKYGHWESDEASASGQNLEFFEYVEAVKLTGDLNVPAGQVTFRARTGRESRLSHRGAYPEELGVVTRYKGQGRLAEPGFRNPQWIDGELVLLDGKGGGHTNGAALGFVYSVPERHFLVLFKRLNLSLD